MTNVDNCQTIRFQPEYLLEPDVVDKIRDLDLESEAVNKILRSILGEALEESSKVVILYGYPNF